MTHLRGIPATIEDIRFAYRLLLGREPDPDGQAAFGSAISAGRLSREDLVQALINSQEYALHRGDTPVEVKLDGYSMFVRPSDRDIGSVILAGHAYEPHVASVVREHLRAGSTFVDVGANIGYFTALAAHLVGPGGTVVAVEPLDKNLQLIYAAIWRNRFDWVEAVPFAASSFRGLLPIATHGRTSNGQVELLGAADQQPAAFAPARPLDDLLANLASLHVLKIDIEGHELIALRGFAAGLARHRPLLLTEFHPMCMRQNSGIDPDDYLAFLFEYGGSIRVLRHEGGHKDCSDAAAIMREWTRADEHFASNGAVHLDLFVSPR